MLRNPIVQKSSASYMIGTPTPSLQEISQFSANQNDDDSRFIEYLGECITFKVNNEIALLTRCINACVIEYEDYVTIDKSDFNRKIESVIRSSDLYSVPNLVKAIGANTLNDFIRFNINSLLISLSSECTIPLRVVSHLMEDMMIEIRELILISISKIEAYIKNSF